MNTAEDAITMIQTLTPEDRQKVKSFLLADDGFVEENYSDEDIEKILQTGKEIDEGVNIERFSSMKDARKSLGLSE